MPTLDLLVQALAGMAWMGVIHVAGMIFSLDAGAGIRGGSRLGMISGVMENPCRGPGAASRDRY